MEEMFDFDRQFIFDAICSVLVKMSKKTCDSTLIFLIMKSYVYTRLSSLVGFLLLKLSNARMTKGCVKYLLILIVRMRVKWHEKHTICIAKTS